MRYLNNSKYSPIMGRLQGLYDHHKEKAAEYYREAYHFAMSHEGFDQDAADWFLSEPNRLESNQNVE
jgi:hypothetical protein